MPQTLKLQEMGVEFCRVDNDSLHSCRVGSTWLDDDGEKLFLDLRKLIWPIRN